MNLPCHRYADTVKAFQQLEAPTPGWRHCGLIDLVWHRLMVLGSLLSKSALCHRVDQSGQGHDHKQPFDAVGLCEKQRRDKKQGVFEESESAVHVRLTFGGGYHLGSAYLVGIDMGTKDIAGLGVLVPLNRLVIHRHVSLDLPLGRLAWRVGCGTTLFGLACVWAQVVRLHVVLCPARGQCRQGILSGLRGATTFGLQVKELLLAGLVRALCGVGERGFSTLKSRL